jgi:hypothetical protein
VQLGFLVVEPADPSGSRIVAPVATEHVMHLIDQSKSEVCISGLASVSSERDEVAHGECVGPKVAPRTGGAAETAAFGELHHERTSL